MPQHELLQLGANISWVMFLFAVGACVGSLTNVLVYRLPLGLGVVTQGSRCPACGTPLTWRENIPVLGWVLLRGKCRFCKTRISPEYPLVEFFVGLLFAMVFVLWYWLPSGIGDQQAVWLGLDWSKAAPEWALSDRFDAFPRSTWAPLIVMLVLLGSLVAMTLVDAKTFTIPLQIPWFATVVGIAFHTIGAALVGTLRSSAPGTGWAIPTPGGSFVESAGAWFQIGVILGGCVGLGVGLVLLKYRLIHRSFEDYPEWEAGLLKAREASRLAVDGSPGSAGVPEAMTASSIVPGAMMDPTHQAAGPVGDDAAAGGWRVAKFIALAGVTIAIATAIGAAVGPAMGLKPWSGLVIGCILGPLVCALVLPGAKLAPVSSGDESAPELWIQYPYARREMLRELLFLTPCVALGWVGGLAAQRLAGGVPPFWLVVLCGSLMGYLIGGGIVWLVRIVGSLAFGKEAMGLGDVHLMAAVGACAGWMDAALAFPLAAFVGLYWVVVARVRAMRNGEVGGMRAMPFGPYLAIATAIVILGKPVVELGLNAMMPSGPDVPAINLP